MTLEELEARVRTLEDIEEIKKLQRIYGFYLDRGMGAEIVALFSDSEDVSVEISDSGVYQGKKGVERMFMGVLGGPGSVEGAYKPATPDTFQVTMQLQGVVHVDPDGKTAKGRWNNLMLLAIPAEGKEPLLGQGVYEIEYVKEDGKWKFRKFHFYLAIRSPLKDGWVKTPVSITMKREAFKPDKPSTVYEPYPTAYTPPFHYPHPITGYR